MATLVLNPAAPAGRGLYAELRAREPRLARLTVVLLGLAGLTLILMQADPRTLDGTSVWMKPTRFLLAVAAYAATFAWFMGNVDPSHARQSRLLDRSIKVAIAGSIFELAWIGWQAAHGRHSHFNFDTPLYGIMYGLMGVVVLMLIASLLPLAAAVWRHPAAGVTRDYAAAVTFGLFLTVFLGGGAGAAISLNGSHSVGEASGALPLLGWNRLGGDLRPAHFIGIHASQALPLFAWLVRDLAASRRVALIGAFATIYMLVNLLVFWRGWTGQSLLPL